MENILKTKSQRALDAEIERLSKKLSEMDDPAHENYAKISDNLRVLCEAREKKDPASISYEQMLAIGANIVGLIMILNFEKTGSITSKAFGWIWKK